MGLTREQVLHIARLARLGLSEEDVVKFQEQLSEILDHFDVLRQVDTESVPPTSHTLDLENVTSSDSERRKLTERNRAPRMGTSPMPGTRDASPRTSSFSKPAMAIV